MPTDNEKKARLARMRKLRFQERNRTFSFSIPRVIVGEVEQRAKELGCTIPEYAKKLIEADMHGTGYVLPSDGTLQDLSLAIRRIGNNANQLTRYVNSRKSLAYTDIQAMQSKLLELEQVIVQTLTKPHNIKDIIRHHLQEHPNDREKLIAFLTYDY